MATHVDQYGNLVDHGWFPGTVVPEGLQCDVPGCGAIITNQRENIRSHISKFHRRAPAYQDKQAPRLRFCGSCVQPGGYRAKNFNAFLKHCRDHHAFRGHSKLMWLHYLIVGHGGSVVSKPDEEYDEEDEHEDEQHEHEEGEDECEEE
ncbi:hypothetical protein F5Y04DRAFT_282878 [Hypomontagnella monticulosa]|nr:hypothetical protein F5Y04DRAFT_282878 [Hypomontagnella monticulosa]